MNKKEQYEEYLTKLYQDWYKEIKPIKEDPDTIHYATFPSLDNLKKIFKTWLSEIRKKPDVSREIQVWFEQNKDGFKEKICNKWNDLSEKDDIQKIELLATALIADSLAITLPIPTGIMTISAILVIKGYLDRLCVDQNEE